MGSSVIAIRISILFDYKSFLKPHPNVYVGELYVLEFCLQEGACEIPVPEWSDQGDALDLH